MSNDNVAAVRNAYVTGAERTKDLEGWISLSRPMGCRRQFGGCEPTVVARSRTRSAIRRGVFQHATAERYQSMSMAMSSWCN